MPSKDLLQELVQRNEIKRELEDELSKLQERMQEIKNELREQFLEEGIASTTCIDGNGVKLATVFTVAIKYPNIVNKELLDKFIKENKLGHLYTIGHKTLQGFVNNELEGIDPVAYADLNRIGLDAFVQKDLRIRKA